MKELLEEYVLEKRQLVQQQGLLLSIIAAIMDETELDTFAYDPENGFQPAKVSADEERGVYFVTA